FPSIPFLTGRLLEDSWNITGIVGIRLFKRRKDALLLMADRLVVVEVMTLDIPLSGNRVAVNQTGDGKLLEPSSNPPGINIIVCGEDLADDPLRQLLEPSLIICEVP